MAIFFADSASFSNITVTGLLSTSQGLTGSLLGTSSWAVNFVSASSYVLNSQTSSFILNSQTSSMLAPYVLNSSTSSFVTNSQTSSFIQNSQTASFLTTNSFNSYTGSNTSLFLGTSSFAITASIANDFTIRGNLVVSGNTTIGDNTTDSIIFNAATMSLGSGTGILNIDNNTLYINGNNHRVGIGTSSPIFLLDVSGSGRFTDELIISGSTRLLTISSGSSIEFQVTNTGIKIGNALTDTHQITGSLNAQNITGSIFGSSSYALTASFALNAGGGSGAGFPYSGSAVITGSLLVSGNGITGSLFGTSSYTTDFDDYDYLLSNSFRNLYNY